MANQLILDRALDQNGYISPGGKATIYAAGTATLITVYSDEAGTVAAANPIVADGNGFWPQRYVSVNAKAMVTDADDVALYTLDPAPVTQSTGSAASLIPFTPSVDVPENNVQDAIDYLAGSLVSGFADFGLGITGNTTLLASIDATGTGAGVYRFDGTSTGIFPTGVAAADTGLIEYWRQSGATAMQFLFHATSDRVFHRRMASTAWGTWREVMTVNQALAEGDTFYRGASSIARLAKGTAGQVLKMNSGATAPEWASDAGQSANSGNIALSGAGPFAQTGIPATAKRIRVFLEGASLSGTDNILIQIGDSGGYETTGYVTYSDGVNSTSGAGFFVRGISNGTTNTGIVELVKHPTTNNWSILAGMTYAATAGINPIVGTKLLSATLDRIQLTKSGADTFDAGSLVFEWES